MIDWKRARQGVAGGLAKQKALDGIEITPIQTAISEAVTARYIQRYRFDGQKVSARVFKILVHEWPPKEQAHG